MINDFPNLTENTKEQNKQNARSNDMNLENSIVNFQIQKSLDILNEILDIQDETIDQGLFNLPEFLDEKVSTIVFEPIKLIGQKIINSRKKLNEIIQEKIIQNASNSNDNFKSVDENENTYNEKQQPKPIEIESSSLFYSLNSDENSQNTTNDEIYNSDTNNYKSDTAIKCENDSENDNIQYYDTFEVQTRQRCSSDYVKKTNTNQTIPTLSFQIINNTEKSNSSRSQVNSKISSPTKTFKMPSLSKSKQPFFFRKSDRALSTATDSSIPLFETSKSTPSTPQINKSKSDFVNDEEIVKKISDSCLHPLPNFASICSLIEKIDKTLSDYNKTKFDQFANAETRLKNIASSIQSFIRMNNKIEQNLNQILSDGHLKTEKEEKESKNENEFMHIKKSIHSLLLLKEEQNKKIKQQAKEITQLKSQIESLQIFIKNNQKQIAKFKQQFFNNLSSETVENKDQEQNRKDDDDNSSKNVEISLHLKQRSKSIDFFNSFLLDDENDSELTNYCNRVRMTHDDAHLHEMIKQIDQLLCTIDNQIYDENEDIEFRLEKLRERISKLYRVDEDQITKNWTLICAEGAEIENPEIRSYFFEKQYSETQAKLLSLEKQRIKLFELFFSFSNNKSRRDSEIDQDDDDDDDELDDYISNSISESILDDLNEKILNIEKMSKIIVDLKKEIDSKNKNCENLTKQLNKQSKENQELIKKYEEISNKFSDSENQLNTKLREIRSLNRKNGSNERKIEQLERRLNEINEQNKKNGSITEIKNISNSLVGELSSLKLLADQQEGAINELYQIKEQLEDELEATKEALKDSMVDIQNKAESLKTVENQLKEEKENMNLKSIETNEIKSLLEHQIKENEKLNETIKILTNSSLDGNELIQNESDKSISNENGNNDSNLVLINSLRKQIALLTEENERKELQIKDLNKQILSSEPKIFSLRRKSLSQKNIINQLTGQNEEMKQSIQNHYQGKINKLNEIITELESQLPNSTKQASIDNDSSEIASDMKNELSNLTEQNIELKKNIEEMRGKLQFYESRESNSSQSIHVDETSSSNLSERNISLQDESAESVGQSSDTKLLLKKSREILCENFLSIILGENISCINDEQLIGRFEAFQASHASSDQQPRSMAQISSATTSGDAIDGGNCSINNAADGASASNDASEMIGEKVTLYQSEVSELTSQLECCRKELEVSRCRTREILSLLGCQDEELNDTEFSKVIQKLKSDNETLPKSDQNSETFRNKSGSQAEEQKEEAALKSEVVRLSSENKELHRTIDNSSNDENESKISCLSELQLRIAELEKENEKLRILNQKQFNSPLKKSAVSLLISPVFDFSPEADDAYDDRFTICIPSLSKSYGYDSNRFSCDMSYRFGPVSTASISNVFLPNDEYLTFGFVNFTSQLSDMKLFESSGNDDSYYLKSQVIVTNLPFGIKKSEVICELSKLATSLSINLNEFNVKNVFYENSVNPEYLIDFKNSIDDAQAFVEAIQNMNLNNQFSYHMSGFVPLAFFYDPCPYRMNENRQNALNKYSSNARLIAMMRAQQFQEFDFNSYFNGIINKSENDAIYRPQIISNENHNDSGQFRLVVDRRFVVSDNFPNFKKFEVVFLNDLEAVMAQTFALTSNCDILQIFHSNFKGNRIAGNDF